jgi:transposase
MQIPTDEEIRKVYEQGPEAVIALFHAVFGQIDTRLQALEDRVVKNSKNSGKPPSSDGLNKPSPKSGRKRHGRKNGGQFGHPGQTLKAVEKPDYIEVHAINPCAQRKYCGTKNGRCLTFRQCEWKSQNIAQK